MLHIPWVKGDNFFHFAFIMNWNEPIERTVAKKMSSVFCAGIKKIQGHVWGDEGTFLLILLLQVVPWYLLRIFLIAFV